MKEHDPSTLSPQRKKGLARLAAAGALSATVASIGLAGNSAPQPVKPKSPMTYQQVEGLTTKPEVAKIGDGTQALSEDANGLVTYPALESQVEQVISSETPGDDGIVQAGAEYEVPVVPKKYTEPLSQSELPASSGSEKQGENPVAQDIQTYGHQGINGPQPSQAVINQAAQENLGQ